MACYAIEHPYFQGHNAFNELTRSALGAVYLFNWGTGLTDDLGVGQS